MKRRLILIIIGILFVAGASIGGWLALKNKRDTSQTASDAPATASDLPLAVHDARVRLIATGDMIPHDAINKVAKISDGTYNYYPMMQNMQPFFDGADVRFCNQAVLGAGKAFGITGYPVFNAPTEFSRDMHKLGCNVVNTGTNHTNDKGQAAIDASVAVWDDLPGMLAVAGANRSAEEQASVRYFSVKGIKFAFVSYTSYINTKGETSYGLNSFDETLMRAQLTEARSKADIVLASARWGTEYSAGINANQDAWAQKMADMGADIVLGHGPHFLEPVKKLTASDGRDVYVWYSLGNFLNAQLETESLFNGIAIMDYDITTKKLTAVSYLPVYVHYEWTESEKAAEDLLARSNFAMYPIDEADAHLEGSQLNTTAAEQTTRISDLLNTYTPIKIITSKEY